MLKYWNIYIRNILLPHDFSEWQEDSRQFKFALATNLVKFLGVSMKLSKTPYVLCMNASVTVQYCLCKLQLETAELVPQDQISTYMISGRT